jgi:feruloyl esterase
MIARAKVPLIANAVMQACDALDGANDGLIDDPRRCDWQPAHLACPKGRNAADCLTGFEVAALDHWYMPVTGGDGRIQYPGGVPKGSEPFWPLWLTGLPGSTQPALLTLFATDFLRYMAFVPDRGATFSVRDYDFDRDPPRLATMARIYDATNPDLGAFRDRGGKLIVYHGWADPLVTPQRTLDYFAEVRARMGGAIATDEFALLFMVPGFDHCGMQPGPGATTVEFDPLPALEAWVEQDRAPATLDVRWRMTDGRVRERTVAHQ